MLSTREKLHCTAAKVYIIWHMQWYCLPSPLCIPVSLPRMPAVFKRMARSLNASARRFWSLHNSCSDHKTLKMSWRFNRPIGSNRHIFCHIISQGYSKGSDIQSQKLLLHLIIQALHHCRPGCREGIGLEKMLPNRCVIQLNNNDAKKAEDSMVIWIWYEYVKIATCACDHLWI